LYRASRDAVTTRSGAVVDRSAEDIIINRELVMKNSIALIAIATLATGLCAQAQASTMSEVPSEAVQYSDLNSTNNHDAAVLFKRIDAAAGRVCGEKYKAGSLFISPAWHNCVRVAIREAVAKVNSPAVTSYAAAQDILQGGALLARRN
jgi:UrcA family protein